MNVLVCLEEQGGALKPDGLAALGKAASIADAITAVICGHGIRPLAEQLASCGAGRVIVIDHPAFASPLPALRAAALTRVVEQVKPELLLFTASVMECDVAAMLASQLEAGLCWGMIDLEVRDGRLIGRKLTDMDSVLVEVEWRSDIKIVIFRPGALPAVSHGGALPVIEDLVFEPAQDRRAPRVIGHTSVASGDGLALSKADVVVSGGRGIGKPENLALIRNLASALDGVAGVSLPLVEMGWAPRSMQVGQTGEIVKPRLYVACGISGQIQHLLGIEQSGTIVAINNDPRAPIMRHCDLAVVADFQAIAPPLIELLEKRRAGG